MKLSDVIRLALEHTYGVGPGKSTMMCFAIYELGNRKLITQEDVKAATEDVHELVQCFRQHSVTLFIALVAGGYISKDAPNFGIQYTTQLYVWWCFDLIRKGM